MLMTWCGKPLIEEKVGRNMGGSVLIYISSGNFKKGQEGRAENWFREQRGLICLAVLGIILGVYVITYILNTACWKNRSCE